MAQKLNFEEALAIAFGQENASGSQPPTTHRTHKPTRVYTHPLGRRRKLARPSPKIKTELEVVEGMQFDSGHLSPYFIADMAKLECVLENAGIIICETKVSRIRDILPLWEKVL